MVMASTYGKMSANTMKENGKRANTMGLECLSKMAAYDMKETSLMVVSAVKGLASTRTEICMSAIGKIMPNMEKA